MRSLYIESHKWMIMVRGMNYFMQKLQSLRATQAGIILLIWTILFVGFVFPVHAADKDYYRIVVLGDPHYPSKIEDPSSELRQRFIQQKLALTDDVDAWTDVDLVAVVGDIVAKTGSAEDYRQAGEFLGRIKKPVAVVAGNHEFMYEDMAGANGRYPKAAPAVRKEKLERFQKTFGLESLYYTKMVGNYLLVFLSPDVTDGNLLTEVSTRQLAWLRGQLATHSKLPTIVFFHAPLANTLLSYNEEVNTKNFIAQPEEEIRTILKENPQVLVWVSGHTHTPATNLSFHNPVNLYEGHVLNIHCPDLDRGQVWTNSLFLYPDKIRIRTFSHNRHEWAAGLDRVVQVPAWLDGVRVNK